LQSFPPKSIDLAIVGTYFAVTILVGWIFRGKAHSSSEFFHAARTLPVVVTAIAFVAANCGALEIVGVVSASAKYGAETFHFYWIGAIPAMLFLALWMMPIYMRSRALTVPEFLTMRFDESTRLLNITCCAAMMVLVSGISWYAMSQVLRTFLGWSFTQSTLSTAAIVFLYVSLGGLTATIYNEVIQFGLIVLGLLPLVVLILRDFHGMAGLGSHLQPAMRHTWVGLPLASPHTSRMDVLGEVVESLIDASGPTTEGDDDHFDFSGQGCCAQRRKTKQAARCSHHRGRAQEIATADCSLPRDLPQSIHRKTSRLRADACTP
jgi:solute:Na+ symporter, SSS family